MDQSQILRALSQGDKWAYETVYNEFYGVMYHLSVQYLRENKVAEEMVQDSFLKLWEIRQSLDDQFNLRNFLYTVTKNNCLNYLRNLKIAQRHQDTLKYMEMQFNYEALDRLGTYLEFDELKSNIENALKKLPDDLRQTFLLSRYDELSYKEIAHELSISIKTVEARMSKALRLLREELKDYLAIILLISNML